MSVLLGGYIKLIWKSLLNFVGFPMLSQTKSLQVPPPPARSFACGFAKASPLGQRFFFPIGETIGETVGVFSDMTWDTGVVCEGCEGCVVCEGCFHHPRHCRIVKGSGPINTMDCQSLTCTSTKLWLLRIFLGTEEVETTDNTPPTQRCTSDL